MKNRNEIYLYINKIFLKMIIFFILITFIIQFTNSIYPVENNRLVDILQSKEDKEFKILNILP